MTVSTRSSLCESSRVGYPQEVSRRLLLLPFLLVACGESEPEPPVDLVTPLVEPGPHAVGYRTYRVTYRPPLATQDRETFVLAWYPAQETDGEHPLYVAKKSEVAVVDAPPLDLGKLPVVMFSHGHQGYAGVASYLMEHFASHGYLAIAPTHTGNTFTDGGDRQTEIYYERILDTSRALDFFESLTNDPLAGKVGDKALITGHSFGGYSAYALAGASFAVDAVSATCNTAEPRRGWCSTIDADKEALFTAGFHDDRFDAAIALDGGDFDLFDSVGASTVKIPVLSVVAEYSGHPPKTPSADSYFSALKGDKDVRVLVLGGAHNDMVDSCAAGVTIRCSDLPYEKVLRLVRGYALAYARSVLDGDATMASILDGSTSFSSLAEVTTAAGR